MKRRDATQNGEALAGRLHTLAIRLLRRLRAEDRQAGVSAARLSVLSVLVHAGPQTLGGLADAEQLRLPTISRLVSQMQAEGLVARKSDTSDARVRWIRATGGGRRLLERARRNRLRTLDKLLQPLEQKERNTLEQAIALLERRLSG